MTWLNEIAKKRIPHDYGATVDYVTDEDVDKLIRAVTFSTEALIIFAVHSDGVMKTGADRVIKKLECGEF